MINELYLIIWSGAGEQRVRRRQIHHGAQQRRHRFPQSRPAAGLRGQAAAEGIPLYHSSQRQSNARLPSQSLIVKSDMPVTSQLTLSRAVDWELLLFLVDPAGMNELTIIFVIYDLH